MFYDNSLRETSKSAFWVDCCVCPETLHDPDLQVFLKIYSLSRLRTMASDWVVIIITPAASPSAANHTSVSWRSSLEKANKTTSLAQCRDEIMRPVDQTSLQLWSGVRRTQLVHLQLQIPHTPKRTPVDTPGDMTECLL